MSVCTCTSCDCGIYKLFFELFGLRWNSFRGEGNMARSKPGISDKNDPVLLELFIFKITFLNAQFGHFQRIELSLDINDWRGAGTALSVFCTVCWPVTLLFLLTTPAVFWRLLYFSPTQIFREYFLTPLTAFILRESRFCFIKTVVMHFLWKVQFNKKAVSPICTRDPF